MLFYMDVRYAGASGVTDLELIDDKSHSGSCWGISAPCWPGTKPTGWKTSSGGATRGASKCMATATRSSIVPSFAAAIWGAAGGVT
jgi:hypothetical protein